MNADGVTFAELLGYTADETQRWCVWFTQNTAALALPFGDASRGMGTMRTMLAHIFFCERYYADLLTDTAVEMAEYSKMYAAACAGTLEGIFAIGTAAQQRLAQFAAQADGDAIKAEVILPYPPGERTVGTKRKFLAHVLLHSMRHWAQITTVLRQNGLQSGWEHDFVFSRALE